MSEIVFTGCLICHAGRFPRGPRQHEGHFALRLGDYHNTPIDIFIDGVQETQAVEALAGREGYVVRFLKHTPDPPFCYGHRQIEVLYQLVSGNVDIRSHAQAEVARHLAGGVCFDTSRKITPPAEWFTLVEGVKSGRAV